MRKDMYDTFLRLYAENKPFEELATQKALSYFNVGEGKPYEITETQENYNYKTINYDAKLDNGETDINIEVKTDHRSKYTGNFFIEFSQYGKASGLATTEADYYVINDAIYYYLISVEDICELLRDMDEEDTLKVVSVPSRHCKKMVTKGWLLRKSDVLKFATLLP